MMSTMDGATIKALRKGRNESQAMFWQRFGVTQSRGSRFETGGELPDSVNILLKLYLSGVIRDNDLARAWPNA